MQRRMKPLTINVPDTLSERLQRVAAIENNHISSVTRRLLTKALDLEDAEAAARALRSKDSDGTRQLGNR